MVAHIGFIVILIQINHIAHSEVEGGGLGADV